MACEYKTTWTQKLETPNTEINNYIFTVIEISRKLKLLHVKKLCIDKVTVAKEQHAETSREFRLLHGEIYTVCVTLGNMLETSRESRLFYS